MDKIRVAHIITLLELGGAQQNTLFTVEHLDRSKFEVLLICGSGGFLDLEAKKIPDLKIVFMEEMVRPVHPLKDLLCLFKLVQILKKEKPAIVHTHSSKAGILGRVAAFLAGVPVLIHSIHGFGFNPYQKIFTRWLFIALEKWIAKFTDCLIAVTKDNIEQGLELRIGTHGQYQLIRSGVDIQKIKKRAAVVDPAALKRELGIEPGSKIVITIGPFKVQKNPTAFIALAKKVTDRLPETRFLMVGDGQIRGNIESLIHTLGLEKQVQLLGWRRDIPELLTLCDIFVLTSLWEGLPRAAVESFLVGKPVIAFAVDGLKEIVKEGVNGFLVHPNALDEMSEKIIRVLMDAPLAKKLEENALKSIDPLSSFDIHRMVEQQEKLYGKLAITKGLTKVQ